jgi:hypothetical protein
VRTVEPATAPGVLAALEAGVVVTGLVVEQRQQDARLVVGRRVVGGGMAVDEPPRQEPWARISRAMWPSEGPPALTR